VHRAIVQRLCYLVLITGWGLQHVMTTVARLFPLPARASIQLACVRRVRGPDQPCPSLIVLKFGDVK
jgi:hypothetical protein